MIHMIKKGVAVFFLVFVLFDLFVPGFCSGDEFEESQSFASPIVESDSLLMIQFQPNPYSDPSSHRDECFCCCSHLDVQKTVSLSVIESATTTPQRLLDQVDLPSYFSIYHPPRTA